MTSMRYGAWKSLAFHHCIIADHAWICAQKRAGFIPHMCPGSLDAVCLRGRRALIQYERYSLKVRAHHLPHRALHHRGFSFVERVVSNPANTSWLFRAFGDAFFVIYGGKVLR